MARLMYGAIYSMRRGKLYLKHDIGTMEFARQ